MKKIYLLLFTILMTATSFGQDLIITSVYDGPLPGGLPKGVELYVVNDIADLSIYGVGSANNGGGTNGEEFTFPVDAVTAGSYLYVASEVIEFNNFFGFDPDYNAGSAMGINGDDAIELFMNGSVTDVFGEISIDATGTPYDYGDGWAYRVDGTGPDGSTFVLGNWSFSGPNALDNETSNGSAASPVPVGTYSQTASTVTTITINSPSNLAVLNSGTTSVDINFTAANLGDGDQVDITVTKNGGTPEKTTNVTSSPFTIASTSDGDVYVVTAEIVNGATQIDSQIIDFSISYPCDLVLGTITTTCDATTAGVDTYTTTIDFTDGGTSTYTIDTGGVGTVDLTGGDPSSDATGTITITGVDEGVDFSINFLGDPADSNCDISRNINAPACVPSVCASVGSIIITEVMQNPSANGDPNGEYFEVYNTTGSPIDMQGWIIKDDTNAGETHAIGSTLNVPAGGYIVIGNVATTTPTLDYNYGNDISLGNGTDGVIIECSSTTIDVVIWDNGATFPDPSGASMELSSNKLNATDNDDGANWSVGTVDIGNGDLGSPGAINNFTLSIGINEIANFAVYPNPVTSGFFTINSANGISKSIQVYDLLGKQVYNKSIQNNERIDVTNLNAGIYILKVEEEGKLATRKLIIE